MSRVVEFRGMDVMTGDWVYGNLVKLGTGSHYIIPQNFIGNNVPQTLVDKETIGQFTRMEDKKNKKVFEGDIIWSVTTIIKNGQKIESIEVINDIRFVEELFQCDEFIIVGNIHEHPHFLETGGEQS
ncbi:YopX family protein [Sutcliffiella horikoshii]|uniref:YopX family protein n=1 Tax=Sutcliffiella horikoshii TaxID=79883 RepID=UPI00203D484F|nr:YopX family protein [Sutcliffiella horikoshii]MCM3620486.1 YopX family protein [Sutcliffiella horikoshii]